MTQGQWGKNIPPWLAARWEGNSALPNPSVEEEDEWAMLEWLQNSNFSRPSDAAAEAPRASLRLNHVEAMTEQYLSDPNFNMNDESVPEEVRTVAKQRQRLDEERQRMIEERAREQVELRFNSFTYTIRVGGTVRIVAYDGSSHFVEIPNRIRGNEVTALDSSLFFEHEELEAVVMPDTVEVLGHRLFEKCTSLQSVRLSSNLKQIGSGVFARCNRIGRVTVNSPVVSAEAKLFMGASVEELAFGPRVREFDLAEFGLKELERISVDPANEALSTDGLAVFSKDGTVLVRLVVPVSHYDVPEGCHYIADRAFDSMKSLSSITLPEGLKGIGRLAFAKTSLKLVQLPQTLEFIGEKAFFFCVSLSEIVLPASVRSVGEEAFSSSGVKKAVLPNSLEWLGQGAFDRTPVQENISQGTIRVFPSVLPGENQNQLRIDGWGGVYMGRTFVELIGQIMTYQIAEGTRAVAPNACKRHRALQFISVPEGVEEIGDDAFRGCKGLHTAELPSTLRRIGAKAFLDTAVRRLRISASVTEIGENALLVQGDNSLAAGEPLESLDLDPGNQHFYIENGLLCQRGGAQDGGDAVLLYLGPDHIVRIPEAVTQLNNQSFCGSIGMDELYLHDHIKSICIGALSTKRTVNVLHLAFAEEVDGTREAHLIMPEYTSRYRSMMPLFETNDKKTKFNFEYYDTWVSCATTIPEFAQAAYARLKNPVRLCKRCRELYEGTFTRKAQAVVSYFAEKSNLEALLQLHEWGFIDMRHVQRELDNSLGAGEAQKTACLLELRKRLSGGSLGGIDFSL